MQYYIDEIYKLTKKWEAVADDSPSQFVAAKIRECSEELKQLAGEMGLAMEDD